MSLYDNITAAEALTAVRIALKHPGYWTGAPCAAASLELFVERTGERRYLPEARYSGVFRFGDRQGYGHSADFFGPTIRDCAENLADFINNNCELEEAH